jgi:Zn-dependent peptidase ImmA (M78 family)
MNKIQTLLTLRQKKFVEIVHGTGISESRLRELLKGVEATAGEVARLAIFLKIPVQDLLPSKTESQAAQLLFRTARSGADEISVASFSRRMAYTAELLSQKLEVPGWAGKFSSLNLTYEEAEGNAERFRELFCDRDLLSPLLKLPQIVANSLEIMLFVVRSSSVEGASAYWHRIPFIFVSERFGPRMLFTLAHELGHLLVHHDPHESFAVFDSEAEPYRKSHGKEYYAHAFACALLMPRTGVALTLRKIREMQRQASDELGDLEIELLARIYGVSFYVAAKRCEDLALLPHGGASALDKILREKYGSAEKRGDMANLPARPDVQFPRLPEKLVSTALEKIRSGEISIGRASAALGLSVSDLVGVNAESIH